MENKLLQIQTELKAPKDLDNKFANYKYRSCESILEALKPLLAKHECLLTITDEMVFMGNRYYVKASAVLMYGDKATCVTAYAREEEIKKGMDSAQITGAASSYARKYALNGLFLIDDTKDADFQNNTEHKSEARPESKPVEHKHTDLSKMAPSEHKVRGNITGCKISGIFNSYTVGGIELSTKQDKIKGDMDLYFEGKDNIEVVYNEQVNGKWTNRYIASVKTLGDGDVPF